MPDLKTDSAVLLVEGVLFAQGRGSQNQSEKEKTQISHLVYSE